MLVGEEEEGPVDSSMDEMREATMAGDTGAMVVMILAMIRVALWKLSLSLCTKTFPYHFICSKLSPRIYVHFTLVLDFVLFCFRQASSRK